MADENSDVRKTPETMDNLKNVTDETLLENFFANDFTIASPSSSSCLVHKDTPVHYKKTSHNVNLVLGKENECNNEYSVTKAEREVDKEVIESHKGDVKAILQKQAAITKIKTDQPTKIDPSSSKAITKFSTHFSLTSFAYLHKIEAHVVKFVRTKIPTLMIKDLLNAKRYKIHGKLHSAYLFQRNGLVFNNVICRATVVGISYGHTFDFVLNDGSGSILCVLAEEMEENESYLPIIDALNTPEITYKPVNADFDVNRGETLQVLGHLDEHFRRKRFVVKKMCKESDVVVLREIQYLEYLESLVETYRNWKKDVENLVQ